MDKDSQGHGQGDSPDRRAAHATRRIVAFGVGLAIVACAIAINLSHGTVSGVGFFRAWWGGLALAMVFAVSELMVVHVQVGRSAHTVSVVEAALVVALFHASSSSALFAQLLGTGLVLVLHRHQRSTKLFFNLAMFSVESQLAFAVFRGLRGPNGRGGVPGLQAWLAAFTATAAFTLTGAVLVFAVIYLAEDTLSVRDLISTIRISAVTSVIMASIGIAASALLTASPAAALLLGVPIVAVFASSQTFVRERRRIEELEFIRTTSAKLLGEEIAESAMWNVLEAARDEFRAEVIEFEHRSGEDARWHRVTFKRGCRPAAVEIDGPMVGDAGLASATLVRLREPTDEFAFHLGGRLTGATAVVAPVRVHGHLDGVLIVSQPSTEVATFGADDLRLADMLSSQLASARENGRLEQSLAEMRTLETKLVFELQHDALTGLLNRAAFERRVRESITRLSPGRVSAMVFIDLDDFKPVNDTYGHAAGDALLKMVAERLVGTIRPHDLASRLGGDEFAVFLNPVANRAEAVEAANRLLAAIARPIAIDGSGTIAAGASIGVSLATPGEDLETVLERADAAMFQAKNRGKGLVEILDPTMNPTFRRAYELERELHGAAERGELDLAFQSVHRLQNHEIVAYECLVRWNHPQHGILGPDQFMSTGLRPGVQREVRRFVSERAGRALQHLAASGYHGPVSINVSAGQALDDTILDDIVALMEATSLGGEKFMIELPEQAFQRSVDTTLRRAAELRESGAGIVLDDLGLDHLTLGFLERLQPIQVKLSRDVIADAHSRPGAEPFVRSVVELGRNLGFEVVAKGIEDRASVELASQMGCQLGQGYFLSRPEAIDGILSSVRKGAVPGGPSSTPPRSTTSPRLVVRR